MHDGLSKFFYICLIMTFGFSGYGGVVCFGSDGHIAFEIAFHDHHHHDGHDDHDQYTDHETVSDGCNRDCVSCEDIPLTNHYPGNTISKKNIPIGPVFEDYFCLPQMRAVSRCVSFETSKPFHAPLKYIVLLT